MYKKSPTKPMPPAPPIKAEKLPPEIKRKVEQALKKSAKKTVKKAVKKSTQQTKKKTRKPKYNPYGPGTMNPTRASYGTGP
tara:strand:- start:704 stop:946 length:243 start_codon:yes stop_codon:yes gene_type:complete